MDRLFEELTQSNVFDREKIITSILAKIEPKIKKMAHKYSMNSRSSYEDYCQEGMLAAYQAISEYKKESDASFTTFAYYTIRHNMQKLKCCDGVLNATALKQLYKSKKLEDKGMTQDEICDFLGITNNKFSNIKKADCQIISTNQEVEGAEGGVTILDTIATKNDNPESSYLKAYRAETIENILKNELNENEFYFINNYFLRESGTIEEIAKSKNLTKQRGQQIIVQGLKKLKNSSSSEILKEMLLI